MKIAPTVLKQRAHLLGEIRAFFQEKNVLEVETPVLGQSGVCDPHLQNLVTQINTSRYFLQTSPEYHMKRLLASGSGSIYQICKAFRDDEQGRYHNPEFTMVEWYRTGFNYLQLMDEVEQLIAGLIGIEGFHRLTYQDAFQKTVGIDPFSATEVELEKKAGQVSGQTSRNDLLDLILAEKVLPALKGAVFIYDYPADQAAMAKIRGDVAERFELIINGIELANGYSELIDPVEQKKRFNDENKQREAIGMEPMPIDQQFLKAMTEGIPDCAGVALGFDRLVMLACNKNTLADVMPFPVEIA